MKFPTAKLSCSLEVIVGRTLGALFGWHSQFINRLDNVGTAPKSCMLHKRGLRLLGAN